MTEEKKQKHAGGRPKLWKSAEELQEKINAYLAHCEEKKKPLTICGLAVFLDCTRPTIINYNKDDEFFSTISRIRQMIEAYAAESLYGSSVSGIIFSLKNNYGWKDQQEIKHSGDQDNPIVVKDSMTKDELIALVMQDLTSHKTKDA